MSHWKRAPHDGAFHRKRPASEIYRRRSTRCGLVYFLAVPPVLRSEIHDRPVKLGGNPLADLPGVCSPIARSGRRQPSQVLAQTLEERMPDLPRRRLRAVLDLGQELRFDPDALCERSAWHRAASCGSTASTASAGPRQRLCRSHGRPCLRRPGRRPCAGRRRARPTYSRRAAKPAMVSVSRCAQVFLTQSLLRPAG